jgi:hypothetical protein
VEDGPAAKSNTWDATKSEIPRHVSAGSAYGATSRCRPRCSRRSASRRRASEFVAMTRIGEGFSLRGNPPPIIVRCSIKLPFPTRGEGTITSTAPATPISSPALSRGRQATKKGAAAGRFDCGLCRGRQSSFVRQSTAFRAVPSIERVGKVVGSWAGRRCAVHSGAKFSDPKETGCQSNTRPA